MAEAEERAKPKLARWGVIVLVLALVALLIAIVWGAGGDLEGERDEGDPEDREPQSNEIDNPEAKHFAPDAYHLTFDAVDLTQRRVISHRTHAN